MEEVTCLENSSYNECGSDREICGGWSDMEHDSMTSDCYQGCFCDDGFIQTRAGVCIPEAECAPAGESKYKKAKNDFKCPKMSKKCPKICAILTLSKKLIIFFMRNSNEVMTIKEGVVDVKFYRFLDFFFNF